ncbi:MAG: ATP-dependent Clp protease proteolytic subunit [Phycisphaerae bacterium]|nr:ATP-dependent Clp protease proteolytic subunit [Phycisphaerae bacterium]
MDRFTRRIAWVCLVAAGVGAFPVSADAPEAEPRGVIIPIDTDISDVTTESLKRRVEQAVEDGATVIVFELNTPGGMLTSALDICDYIKGLRNAKTVAWVHTQAYSAGSMIAVACDEIVMSSRSTLGDCGVILGTPIGAEPVPEELRAKAEAPALTEFRESANRNGYNRLLCEAMVLKEREVWWIENAASGERRFVDTAEKERLIPESGSTTQPAEPDWQLVTTYFDPVSDKDVEFVNPVVGSNALLTMSQSEAYAYGFAKAIVSDAAELQARYSLSGELSRIGFSWLERFTGWMTSMPVRAFLLIIILLGAYVEFNTPGVGVPGLVALIALAIFVGAPYMTGLANIWELVIILIGVALLAIELFVTPGFGVIGLLGILVMLVGLLATFIPEEPGRSFPIYWPSLPESLDGLRYGAVTLAAGLAGALVGAWALSKYLPELPLLRLAAPVNPTRETVAVADPYHGAAQLGDIGQAVTPLRPGGSARFGATLVDVITEGEWIEAGSDVEVIERHGNTVVVRRPRS